MSSPRQDPLAGPKVCQQQSSVITGPSSRHTRVWTFGVLACLGAALVAGAAVTYCMARRDRPTKAVWTAYHNLLAYSTAQTRYIMSDWHGDGKRKYASSMQDLWIDSATGKQINLIPRAFADAHGASGAPWMGYRFMECKTIGGKPVDWSSNFALCATPAEYGALGKHTLLISSRGRTERMVDVWGKDMGRSQFVGDFPAEPQSEGWTLMDSP
jgi:hypothetical protein